MKQLEFECTQLHEFPADCRFLGAHVQPQGTRLHDLPLFGNSLLSSQDRPDTGHKLTGAERLHHIIIGPDLEPYDAVRFLALGGQKDHGNGFQPRVGAQAFTDLKAVLIRKQNVQQDKVRRITPKMLQSVAAAAETINFKALAAKVVTDQFDDVFFVFNYDYTRSHVAIIAPAMLHEC